MKNHTVPVVFAVLFALSLSVPALAAPIPGSNLGIEHFMGAERLARWSGGVYGGVAERKVEIGSGAYDMETPWAALFVGYDVSRWLTAYGIVGWTKSELNNMEDADEEVMFGGGAIARLLDHEILDPVLFEDRIRINAGCEYAVFQADLAGQSQDWGELSASLTIGIVNDVVGNKLFLPNAVGLYAGPAYSDFHGGDVTAVEYFGFIGGIDIYYSETVTLEFFAEHYEKDSYGGAISVRF